MSRSMAEQKVPVRSLCDNLSRGSAPPRGLRTRAWLLVLSLGLMSAPSLLAQTPTLIDFEQFRDAPLSCFDAVTVDGVFIQGGRTELGSFEGFTDQTTIYRACFNFGMFIFFTQPVSQLRFRLLLPQPVDPTEIVHVAVFGQTGGDSGVFSGAPDIPVAFQVDGVTFLEIFAFNHGGPTSQYAIDDISFVPFTPQPKLKIGLSLDRSTVEPSANRLKPNLVTARVTVTDTTGQGKSNVSVALNAKAVDLAVAGHDHAGNAPNVLHNLSSAPTGSFQDVVTRQPTQTCMTESDGTCQVFYTAELVSGRYRIIAALSTDSTVSDSKDLTVQMSGLVPLGQSSAYRLTGSWNGGSNGVTSQHTPNHFGTARLIIGISAATGQYFNAMGGAVLGINDMSLPAGGLFDINNDWSPPHNLHRKGSSVDIDGHHISDGRPVNTVLLDRLARPFLRNIGEPGKIHYELR